MTSASRFLTVAEKDAELAEWEAQIRERPPGLGDAGGRGFPDPDMIPWCAAINAIPGVCTVQSCSGHGSARNGYVESCGHLWLRFDEAMSKAFDAEAFRLAEQTPLMERVYRLYSSWGREIASITFAGNERDSLNDSMALILTFLQSIRERCQGTRRTPSEGKDSNSNGTATTLPETLVNPLKRYAP